MSINLGGSYSSTTNAARASYDETVKLAYQGEGRLRDSVTLKTGIVGETHFFRRFGTTVASQHNTSELITPQDATHTKVACALTNWRVGDYTDLFDQAETTVDERSLLAQTDAKAIGRREDQLIIDALDAATSIAGTVDEDLGGTNSLLNADKLRRAKTYLNRKQVSDTEHTMLVNADGMEGALAETEITSSDYQTMKALVDGSINNKSAFGFKFKCIENRVEGGLPFGSTSIRLCFAYDKAAEGLATTTEPRGYVD